MPSLSKKKELLLIAKDTNSFLISIISVKGKTHQCRQHVVNEIFKIKKSKLCYTMFLGASSTTSAGWSDPILAAHPPLQFMYFCKLVRIKKYSVTSNLLRNTWQFDHDCLTIVALHTTTIKSCPTRWGQLSLHYIFWQKRNRENKTVIIHDDITSRGEHWTLTTRML